MLGRMSDLLRLTLKSSPIDMVTLEEELGILDLYVQIEKHAITTNALTVAFRIICQFLGTNIHKTITGGINMAVECSMIINAERNPKITACK